MLAIAAVQSHQYVWRCYMSVTEALFVQGLLRPILLLVAVDRYHLECCSRQGLQLILLGFLLGFAGDFLGLSIQLLCSS